MGTFFYLILFGVIVAAIGGILQGIYNSKRQTKSPPAAKQGLASSITREQLSEIRAKNRKRGASLRHCVELNNKGISYEKIGKSRPP